MSNLAGVVQGLHHITLVTRNQEVNRRFYTEILGLRRVKLTVNQDDIYHRHLFYADERGTTGTAITFFEWPELPRGRLGLGSPHHLAYTVPRVDALPKWKVWLQRQRVPTTELRTRDGHASLYLRDPDGVIVELTALTAERLSTAYLAELERELSETQEISPDMRLTRFHHATPISSDLELTRRFVQNLLGLAGARASANPDDARSRLLEIGSDERPDFLRYLVYENAGEGLVGTGNIHHIAVAVEGEAEQLRVMHRLNDAGIRHSGVIDRLWFRSLYFRDPDGNLLEIATKGPGYTQDEPLDQLGSRLVLPPWLEPQRTEIETKLAELDGSNPAAWPPVYDASLIPGERL